MKLPTDKLNIYANRLVGKRLKEFRKSKNIKQYELADRLNLTPQQISNYEIGTNQIPFDVLVKIAFVLDCSCADILNPADFDSLKATIEDIRPRKKSTRQQQDC